MKRMSSGVLLLVIVLASVSAAARQPDARAVSFGVPCDARGDPGSTYESGINCRLVDVDGYPRQFIAYVPASATVKMGQGEEVPLVFMLHGTGGDGAKFFKISGWRQLADQEGFVAVFPSGLTYRVQKPGEAPKTTTKWNSFDLASYADPDVKPAGYPPSAPWPADDVSFMRSAAADVSFQLPIDLRRIFLAGFSNGGEMCSRAAVEASDAFAAVGCSAGALEAVHETTPGHPHIPEMLSVGAVDSHALEQIQAIDPSYAHIPLSPKKLLRTPLVADEIERALDSLGLLKKPYTAVTKPTFTVLRFGEAEAGNDDANELDFVVLAGVDHQYPNGSNNPLHFRMASQHYDFFLDHPLAVAPSLPPPPPAACASDCQDPQTKITKHPKGRGHDRSVAYRFTADDAGATFKCRLDKKSYKRCTSPKSLYARKGKHTFRVLATDSSGNKDPKAAKDTFRVLR